MWPLLWKAKEHVWGYISAREMEASPSLRETAAKMLTAKTFYTSDISTETGKNELNPGVSMPEVEFPILPLQTTVKRLNYNEEA